MFIGIGNPTAKNPSTGQNWDNSRGQDPKVNYFNGVRQHARNMAGGPKGASLRLYAFAISISQGGSANTPSEAHVSSLAAQVASRWAERSHRRRADVYSGIAGIEAKNPTNYVRFYTNFPTLVRGLPYIDEVLPYKDMPKGFIPLQYEDAIPLRAHFARVIGDNLGLNVRDVRPDCVIDFEIVKRFRELWHSLPRPHIVVQRRASQWTPNKQWPENYWLELINVLSKKAGVIEIGSEMSDPHISSKNYIDLRAQTSLEELVAAVAAADALVGPPSGPIHIAAAAGIPAVEIIGGYEHPTNSFYNGNATLYTALACAPCWLREPCPYNLKCLKMIKPNTVESA